MSRYIVPSLSLIGALLIWESTVILCQIQPFILPPPSSIATTLWYEFLRDIGIGILNSMPSWLFPYQEMEISRNSLAPSLYATAITAIKALCVAVVIGVGMAIACSQSKWTRMAFTPYTIILQTTPVVVIAPYLTIYLNNVDIQQVACACIIAFFPIFNNTLIGLTWTSRELRELLQLYGATRYQVLLYASLPNALPYFVAGLKISCGLSLMGAVIAEFVIGTGSNGPGLAYRIMESAYRLNTQHMLAATVLLSGTGLLFFVITDYGTDKLIQHWLEKD